jgi:hypothetical protein
MITGSHSLNAFDLRATTSVAAGTTLTVVRLDDGSPPRLNGTGTLAASGCDQRDGQLDGWHSHAPDCGPAPRP